LNEMHQGFTFIQITLLPEIMEQLMKIALVQMQMTENMEQNLKRSLHFMEEAFQLGAKLVCFPEVQLSPFFPQYPGKDASKYLLSEDHPYLKEFSKQAEKCNLVTIPNLYIESQNRQFDASPVFNSDGNLLGTSKMVHIVQWPLFYEQDYYHPSDDGFLVFETTAGKIGVVICFDRHYPESIRTCAVKGAQLVVIPTAIIEGEPIEEFEWELRLAAKHNGIFIALCNRSGLEDQMNFDGGSIVVAPDGNIIARAGNSEQILLADIDYTQIAKNRKERPYLDLRRPELYL